MLCKYLCRTLETPRRPFKKEEGKGSETASHKSFLDFFPRKKGAKLTFLPLFSGKKVNTERFFLEPFILSPVRWSGEEAKGEWGEPKSSLSPLFFTPALRRSVRRDFALLALSRRRRRRRALESVRLRSQRKRGAPHPTSIRGER